MRFIDNVGQLEPCVERILSCSWAAVDTEADSLYHYAEKLSLLQITVGDDDFVIDPLAGLDLSGLLSGISKKELIFHAADSDIRLLRKAYPFSPCHIFDTMIAAQLLGYPRMGLVDLAEKHCGLRLSKAEQKADWSKRPLEQKLLIYAANDTHYLKTIRDAMEAELKEAGRLHWHQQQCEKLLQTLEQLPAVGGSASGGKPAHDAERDWQVKGSKELKGPALTALKALWHWREELAKKKDKPPFKVLNTEYLVQIAKRVAEHPGADIGEWKDAPRNVKGELREAINHVLTQISELPQAQWLYPEKIKAKKRWTDADTRHLTALKTAREKKAAELKINASLLATNATLEELASAKPGNLESMKRLEIMLPWQIEETGEEFLKAFSG